MSRKRPAAPWIALIAAVLGLFSANQMTDAGLERVFRAAVRAFSSLDNSQRETTHRVPRGSIEPVSGLARIIDGDTLDLGRTRIRMRGIDALESDQTCTRSGTGRYDCGKQARDALVALIGGAEVTCTPDGSETYGRMVATCTVPRRDGNGVVDLNAAMVRTGFAFDCKRYSDGAYADEERAAKAARSGAWGGRFEFPWDHRGRANACGRG
ncbi:thermonuclease family protein [Roseomonas marmotae]|uniref:Thermonuclease family protein n=1 Tax=Roseomonas marmotae TaxID=2768161 RepID=A0ABS3KAY3_9PROT|nr:thermonuclease family protein [Roseomonas marmotae]MBO1074090.1 thermonuclease family protein [Roseomonas marmotae]QTI78873.1 thermonuclease family protein [Roseomonas marmotae]